MGSISCLKVVRARGSSLEYESEYTRGIRGHAPPGNFEV